jgi:hypothetical protein
MTSPSRSTRAALAAIAFGAAASVAWAQSSAPAPTAAPPAPSSPAKKDLVQKILQFQQPELENAARSLVERPAQAMLQQAAIAAQQLSPEKREQAGRTIDADARKYAEEAYPLVRERAIRIAPSTVGVFLEEKMTEEELRSLHAWLTGPVNRKYQTIVPEMRDAFLRRLLQDTAPIIEPRAQALDGKIRTALGAPPANAAGPGTAPAANGGTSPSTRPGRPASGPR